MQPTHRGPIQPGDSNQETCSCFAYSPNHSITVPPKSAIACCAIRYSLLAAVRTLRVESLMDPIKQLFLAFLLNSGRMHLFCPPGDVPIMM